MDGLLASQPCGREGRLREQGSVDPCFSAPSQGKEPMEQETSLRLRVICLSLRSLHPMLGFLLGSALP